MTDQNDELEQEQEQEQKVSANYTSGDRADRPSMDLTGAQSTDWNAAAETEDEDSELSEKERNRRRAAQEKREE